MFEHIAINMVAKSVSNSKPFCINHLHECLKANMLLKHCTNANTYCSYWDRIWPKCCFQTATKAPLLGSKSLCYIINLNLTYINEIDDFLFLLILLFYCLSYLITIRYYNQNSVHEYQAAIGRSTA